MTPEVKKPLVTITKQSTANLRVPPSFSKSNDIPASFRADKKFLHVIEKMFWYAKSKTPWDSVSDFYRWAVWEGVQRMNILLQEKSLSNDVGQIKAILETVRDNEMANYTMIAITDTKKRVEILERDGDHDQVLDLLKKVQDRIRDVDADTFIGRKLRREFARQFGGYMDNKKVKRRVVSLKPRDVEEDDD